MRLLSLILSELRWRWATAFVAGVLVVFACVAVLFTDALASGAANATRKIQRDIGPNLVILPCDTDVAAWTLDRSTHGTIAEAMVDALEAEGLAGRLIPLVQAPLEIDEHRFLLTGVGRERTGGKRPALAPDTSDAGAIIGAHVANTLALQVGEPLEIPGGAVEIHAIMQPQGSIEDISIHLPLPDVQQRLGLAGRLTQIDALECRCGPQIEDPLAWLQSRVHSVIPDAQVVRRHAPAEARRRMASQRACASGCVRSPAITAASNFACTPA